HTLAAHRKEPKDEVKVCADKGSDISNSVGQIAQQEHERIEASFCGRDGLADQSEKSSDSGEHQKIFFSSHGFTAQSAKTNAAVYLRRSDDHQGHAKKRATNRRN